MKFKIIWMNNGATQYYTLVTHKCQFKNNYNYFTIYSPIYKAIENGTFILNTGYGDHPFKIEEI